MAFGWLTASAITTDPAELVIVLIGSLLPDIDHPKSTLGRYNPFAVFMKHRGWTHTLIGAAILSAPFYFFGSYFWPMLAGCLTHILADRLQALFKKSNFKIKIWT